MIRFRFVTVFFAIILFSVSAFAQAASVKIGLINTEVFYDDKIGITRLVTAQKQLDNEFAVQIKALQDGGTRLQGLANEIQTVKTLTPAQVNAKRDEGERLQRELNYKKTELESAIARRRQVLVTPISKDIGKGIDEFAKKNGYGAIFDVSKMAESGALLFLAETADITKEFVTFYNARPATAVAPAKPK